MDHSTVALRWAYFGEKQTQNKRGVDVAQEKIEDEN